MKFEMRPYQEDAINAARHSLAKNRAAILKLATGCGKTIIASSIIRSATDKNKRCLFMAHTDELVLQAGDKVSRSTGISYAVEKAQEHGHDTMFPLVVASVQSLSRTERLNNYPPDFFDLIITDEVHRGASDSYVRIYDYFNKAKLIGLTATPFRSDDKALGDVFDEVCFDYGLSQAIKDGWLCPIVSETIPLEIDLSHVKISQGDFKAGDLASAIEPMFEKVIEKLKEKAMDRKICVFLPLVSSSQKFTQMLCDAGFDAEHVDGKSKDRAQILERFSKKGSGSVICNSSLLCEGWDEPSVDCVIDLTPTRSTLRYIQKIGRGTRLCPERFKKDLYVPDFLWHGANHNLCHPSCLVAKTKEVADKMSEMMKKGGVQNIQDAEDMAHQSLVSEREAALARSLQSFVGQASKKFDPVLQSISLLDDTLVDWKPETKREGAEPTQDQIDRLVRHGFDPTGWKYGYAKRVLDIVYKRSSDGLATPKMVRCLLNNGYPMAHSMSFEDAKLAMDKLSKMWEKSKRWRK